MASIKNGKAASKRNSLKDVPSLIADGFVQNLRQEKRNATPKVRSLAATAASYSGCLPADAHWQIPIAAGQRYIISAAISTRCDSRGWTCDNFVTRSGP